MSAKATFKRLVKHTNDGGLIAETKRPNSSQIVHIVLVALGVIALFMVVGFVGIVLFGFLPGDDFGLVNVKTDAYLPRVVNSQSYWKEKAEPFAVPEYAASSNGAMTMALQNKYEDATLILTRINATITLPKMPDVKDDSVAVAKRLSLKFEPGEKKTVELTHNAKAPPGEIYEIYLDFTYKYQNGTEMKQFGAKPLVGKFV